MLVFHLEDLEEEEVDALGTLAVEFNTGTIEDTISACINFCLECVEDADAVEAEVKANATTKSLQLIIKGEDGAN